jgi:hypothetical protein
MKKQIKKAAILGIIAIVGFTLWRNYGVLPKGAVILDSALGSDKENTKEQKELKNKIKSADKQPVEGDILLTSYGYYRFNSTYNWIKINEIWEYDNKK